MSGLSAGYLVPRIGSVCSGIGGLELGLITALGGGTVVWHVEYDKHPSAVLEARFPGVPNLGDVTTTDWSRVAPVDWFTAGYPCQPFSTAGKRRGSKDERHLWPAVRDAIGVLRPGNVLLENVAGHVSLGLDAVLADLAALGYDARWGVVRAADAGAPHRRERIFIVAADTRRGSVRGWARPGGVRGETTTGESEGDQRQRDGHAARGQGAAASADASGRSLAGAAAARDGLSVAPERGDRAAPHADVTGPQGAESAGRRLLSARGAVADAEDSVKSGGAEGTHAAALVGPGARTGHRTGAGPVAAGAHGLVGSAGVEWGPYESAVRRWERVIGRAAPRPTEPGRTGERLSPRFVEWMQGYPDGWVTDVIARNPALKALGNSVVPQQSALAVSVLHHNRSEAVA